MPVSADAMAAKVIKRFESVYNCAESTPQVLQEALELGERRLWTTRPPAWVDA